MADGSFKEIQNIRKGDLVTSYNSASHKLEASRVMYLVIHPLVKDDYLIINGHIKVTKEHRMWIDDLVGMPSYRTAGNLRVGDKLMSESLTPERVNSIETVSGTINNLYNLELEGTDHNYFAEGVLVHNVK
jgi:hypothetical protein